jgi:hypothetical protein
MVFRVDKDYNIIFNKEALKLVPELSSLTQKEALYVILVADYMDGPYRKKPLEERKRMAMRRIHGQKKVEENEKIRLAIDAYRGLIFDIRRETIDVYTRKIQHMQSETLKDDISAAKIKELDNAIDYLQQRIERIQHDLDIEEKDESLNLEGGKKLSQLEKWQRNQRAYKEHKETI